MFVSIDQNKTMKFLLFYKIYFCTTFHLWEKLKLQRYNDKNSFCDMYSTVGNNTNENIIKIISYDSCIYLRISLHRWISGIILISVNPKFYSIVFDTTLKGTRVQSCILSHLQRAYQWVFQTSFCRRFHKAGHSILHQRDNLLEHSSH